MRGLFDCGRSCRPGQSPSTFWKKAGLVTQTPSFCLAGHNLVSVTDPLSPSFAPFDLPPHPHPLPSGLRSVLQKPIYQRIDSQKWSVLLTYQRTGSRGYSWPLGRQSCRLGQRLSHLSVYLSFPWNRVLSPLCPSSFLCSSWKLGQRERDQTLLRELSGKQNKNQSRNSELISSIDA